MRSFLYFDLGELLCISSGLISSTVWRQLFVSIYQIHSLIPLTFLFFVLDLLALIARLALLRVLNHHRVFQVCECQLDRRCSLFNGGLDKLPRFSDLIIQLDAH